MPNKKILIIGYGSIGSRHTRLLKELSPHFNVKVLTSQKPNNQLCIDEIFNTISEALNFMPDICVVSNPAPCHIEISKHFLASGADLLIEKPLTSSLSEAIDFLNFSSNYGNRVQVGYHLRYDPSLLFFRQKIKEGIVGDLYFVNAVVGQFLPDWRTKSYKESVSSQKKLGGGVLLELSHELDYLLWIFGSPKKVFSKSYTSGALSNIDVEDIVQSILIFDPKSNGKEVICNLSQDFIRGIPSRYCEVIGSHGTICWDGLHKHVTYQSTKSSDKTIIFHDKHSYDYPYLNQLRDIIGMGNEFIFEYANIEQSIRLLKLITLMRLSSEKGIEMEFDE